MDISLKGKYALICGSTQGIGLATAKVLAGLGANCILMARNEDGLKAAVAELSQNGQQQHSYAIADFSQKQQLSDAIHKITSSHPVAVLINNTGGPKAGPITKASPEDFESAFQQHLVGNHLLAAAVLPGMKKLGYGRIINIISTSIKTPLPNLGVSNTIRAAVASWAKTLSNEVGIYQITVNNILPGLTDTARLGSLIESTAASQETSVENVQKSMISSIPMARFGQAEEIANVVAFLASPAASYVTGTSIRVDGGRTPAI
ncbi:short-chain dehydrogenase [Pedobacter sp. PACM 27299]|uniref:SDR family oxidoreductase n=1 Tax=Pedobacter sp. PACM 27299 TaxID=1727164 RepID=UPI000705FE3A|nr:SDR family oxidoreductase [Pedobacter sp. PACM 27299]ALL04623.1 short-chain dehydrogenase [Pedobacter sp. PACM 27299]